MSMAINTTNSTLLYKAIGNVQPSNSNVQTTRLSSGNRINAASDDASSLSPSDKPSPSVTLKLSPEAMALQHTEIKDLQILKTPMFDQADASQAVMQLLR